MHKKRGLICIALVIALLTCVYIFNLVRTFARGQTVNMDSLVNTDGDITIVVDAGHGGNDPGKVGVNGALEKDINLKIALELKNKLVKAGMRVIMTRTEDKGLYSDSDRSKKNADLRNRVNIINESNAVLAVSIHQNSYTQESSKGTQVFYYKNSQMSQEAAAIIQESVKKYVNPDNKRVHKPESSYYVLKNTRIPMVIVECGFLSNSSESALLLSEEYQEKMAEGIMLGITEWVNTYITRSCIITKASNSR